MNATIPTPRIFLLVENARVLDTPSDFAQFILELSTEQTATRAHRLIDEDFQIACDAFNLNRISLRLSKDFELDLEQSDFIRQIVEHICRARTYSVEDFLLSIEATRDRVRFPFGFQPLEQAFQRAQQNPIKLTSPRFAETKLPAVIAAIALELQKVQGNNSIVLPVDHIRRLVRQRKLVVGGAIRQLVKLNLLSEQDGGVYGRGKAREYRFVGREGIDYEMIETRRKSGEEVQPAAE